MRSIYVINTHTHTHTHTHIHTHTHTQTHIHTYIHTYIYIYIYTHTYIHIHIYVFCSRFAAASVAVDVCVQLTLYPAVLSLAYGKRQTKGKIDEMQSPDVEGEVRRDDDDEPRQVRAANKSRSWSWQWGGRANFRERTARTDDRVGRVRAGGLEEQLLPTSTTDGEEQYVRAHGAGSNVGGSSRQGRGGRTFNGRGIQWEARVMSKDGRVWVLLAAIVLVVWSLLASSGVERGLEQTDALPTDSFLIAYFRDLADLVQVGPPVFFVVTSKTREEGSKGSFGDPEVLQKLCTRRGCRSDSLGNSVSNAARFTNYTLIATGVSNVADDFISWLLNSRDDAAHACCRQALTPSGDRGPICPAHWNPALHPGETLPQQCICNKTLTFASPACPAAMLPCESAGGCLTPGLPNSAFEKFNATSRAGTCWGVRLAGLCPTGGEHPFCSKDCYTKYGNFQSACVAASEAFPSADDLRQFFGDFVNSECPSDPSDASCAVCGEHYHADLSNLSLGALNLHGRPVPPDAARADLDAVSAARFMSYHAPLRTQAEFISALEYAYKMADDLSQKLDLAIYPYSVFYVFFEQYVGIEQAAMRVSWLALMAVAVIVTWLLGSLTCALLVLATAVAVELSLVGAMGLWGIKLNALSTVNLVAAIGISVEFSVHLVHAFAHASGTREQRALAAMQGVGGAVVSGIAFTKLLGVSVLGMAHSRIFVVYYFRMYLCLVAVGCFYGLIVLPVLLSIFGPPSKQSDDGMGCTTSPLEGAREGAGAAESGTAASIDSARWAAGIGDRVSSDSAISDTIPLPCAS